FWSLLYTLACTAKSVSVLLSVLNRPHFISRQQSIHVSWVRKKVVVTTMESSRSHRVARSACVYKYQHATQVDRTSNTASSWPPDSNRRSDLRLAKHPTYVWHFPDIRIGCPMT